MNTLQSLLGASLGPLVCLLLVCGCGKKSDEASTGAAPTNPVTTAAPSSPAAPAVAQSPVPDAQLKDAQNALKARQYEAATDALIQLQRQQLSDAQAAAVANQMRQLQADLAGALARGDPQAKAAADKLRRMASGAR